MHRLSSSFVLGYHGCDDGVAERLLAGDGFKPSENAYDWLGPGIYFWEANPKRGLEYALELKRRKRRPKTQSPAVVGAVVNLGLCLDLTAAAGIRQVRRAYERLRTMSEGADFGMPRNSKDRLRRYLDCAVVRMLHDIRAEERLPAIDTVKGVFVEGDAAYPDSGFFEQTHIQICVRNPDCIKGVFRVPARFME